MSRRGITLLEMAWTIFILLLVLQTGFHLLQELRGSDLESTAPPGELLDMACDRLRQDAVDGAQVQGESLLAGRHRWILAAGMLARDGRPLVRLEQATWMAADRRIHVHLQAAHRPAHDLELWP